MKMICDVPDEVIKCIKDGMWCGSHIVEKMITNGIPLSSSEELCEDAISRQAVNILVDELARAISDERCCMPRGRSTGAIMQDIRDLPPVNPQETVSEFADRCRECGKMKRCKDCKHFEYDSVANWDGIPIIVAHEICSRWGKGCKTSENGYCFLFEPKEEEGKE